MSAYGDHVESNGKHSSAKTLTAFRAAEKKYQLHLEQQKKFSKGRVRGGKLVPQPVDLSEVIDVRSPSSAAGAATTRQLTCELPGFLCQDSTAANAPCTHDTSSSSTNSSVLQEGTSAVQQHCNISITALTFAAHPGLTVFPAALPPLLQLQLMHAALEDWPEPPTRTNHTVAYACQLRGLFAAAQADLALIEQPPGQQQCQQQDCQKQSAIHPEQQQQPPQHGPPVEYTTTTTAFSSSSNSSCGKLRTQHAASCCITGGVPQHQQNGYPCSQPGAHPQLAPEGLPDGIQQQTKAEASQCPVQTWSASNKGPKATLLLRKLRWASLGPPFNWTDRVYERHVQYTPLPQELVGIACHFAALAAASSNSNSSPGQTAAAAAAADIAEGAVEAAPEQQQQRHAAVYAPDVALVNYYHAGDTLSGHKDDVEVDQTQPIVTFSLGCEAVFLMGGASRDEQPTALLLRSGDVVVLGGPARSCYHAVPRIFTERGLPAEVLAAVEQRPEFRPHMQHMQQCRVNISVRSSQ